MKSFPQSKINVQIYCYSSFNEKSVHSPFHREFTSVMHANILISSFCYSDLQGSVSNFFTTLLSN